MELILQNWEEKDFLNLLEYLKSLATEKYKNFHSALVPNINQFFGVTVPHLRATAKSIEKGEIQSFLKLCEKHCDIYEVNMLQALVTAHIKNKEEFHAQFLKLLPNINNWAVCDLFVAEAKVIGKNKDFYFNFCRSLITSNKPFFIRVALIIYLKYFLEDDYINKVLKSVSTISNDNYYVGMAISWLLAEMFINYNEVVYNYLTSVNKDLFIHKTTIRKIKESYRTDKNCIQFKMLTSTK